MENEYVKWLRDVDWFLSELETFCEEKMGFPMEKLSDETFMVFYRAQFEQEGGKYIEA